MDQMLPSPGFPLSGLTPLQQLEEDQHIGNNPYYPHTMTTGLTPAGMGSGNNSNFGVGSSGLNTNIETNPPSIPSLPSLGMNTPTKGSSYQPSYATPQSMMQPQTPVS